jgi:hypothetical protein
MAPPLGSGRALDPRSPSLDLPASAAPARPRRAPVATTIVLFVVVGVLLAFIAWR